MSQWDHMTMTMCPQDHANAKNAEGNPASGPNRPGACPLPAHCPLPSEAADRDRDHRCLIRRPVLASLYVL